MEHLPPGAPCVPPSPSLQLLPSMVCAHSLASPPSHPVPCSPCPPLTPRAVSPPHTPCHVPPSHPVSPVPCPPLTPRAMSPVPCPPSHPVSPPSHPVPCPPLTPRVPPSHPVPCPPPHTPCPPLTPRVPPSHPVSPPHTPCRVPPLTPRVPPSHPVPCPPLTPCVSIVLYKATLWLLYIESHVQFSIRCGHTKYCSVIVAFLHIVLYCAVCLLCMCIYGALEYPIPCACDVCV